MGWQSGSRKKQSTEITTKWRRTVQSGRKQAVEWKGTSSRQQKVGREMRRQPKRFFIRPQFSLWMCFALFAWTLLWDGPSRSYVTLIQIQRREETEKKERTIHKYGCETFPQPKNKKIKKQRPSKMKSFLLMYKKTICFKWSHWGHDWKSVWTVELLERPFFVCFVILHSQNQEQNRNFIWPQIHILECFQSNTDAAWSHTDQLNGSNCQSRLEPKP